MRKTGGKQFDRRSAAATGDKAAPRRTPKIESKRSEPKREAEPSAHPRPEIARKIADAPRAFRRPSAELAVLYGYHAVREALRIKKRVLLDLFATTAAAEKLAAEIKDSGVFTHIVEPETLSARLGRDSVHQGVLLEARPLPDLDISEIIVNSGLVLALDQITDPHNIGAILRTAAAFGVDAIIATDRHAPEFSGVLAKTASGGLEHVPIVEVVNLARALDQLGAAGFWRVGLDSEGPASLEETALSRPTVLVLGAEGKGLRRLTRERCDVLARLDMPGPIKSLNVSNACAVALSLAHAALARAARAEGG
ncbi:23S rRNA (guanosine(2251)-2'-O)-methyltransferase RlmB [uncultured Rhodoblastus sp.]|uniref:23S rRNA (guanosine(2251)-2'-O)-methyltransferase RlmB n=1 Tax=uncultured Rhodoblastus sp. TaxID=543037 RepID=UPI0025FFA67E|nr:23S rRNA (guanosine(2251)-2'-O)-methyltransferase RlmB [uncultured Rhodoblastus sp.]